MAANIAWSQCSFLSQMKFRGGALDNEKRKIHTMFFYTIFIRHSLSQFPFFTSLTLRKKQSKFKENQMKLNHRLNFKQCTKRWQTFRWLRASAVLTTRSVGVRAWRCLLMFQDVTCDIWVNVPPSVKDLSELNQKCLFVLLVEISHFMIFFLNMAVQTRHRKQTVTGNLHFKKT